MGRILFIFLVAMDALSLMGAFTDLFGYIPRVEVLEAFAETPSDPLSAPDIERITEVSRRAAYLIVRHYVREGLLVAVAGPGDGNPRRFMLNPNDLRAKTLAEMERLITLGSIQAEIKRMRSVSLSEPLPSEAVSRTPLVLMGVIAVETTPTAYAFPEVFSSLVVGGHEVQQLNPPAIISQGRIPVMVPVERATAG
jgi:hypothetical protein